MLEYTYGKHYEIISVSNAINTITIGDKIDFYCTNSKKDDSIVSGTVVNITYPSFVNYENTEVIHIEHEGKRYRKYISSNICENNSLIVPVKGKLVAELI